MGKTTDTKPLFSYNKQQLKVISFLITVGSGITYLSYPEFRNATEPVEGIIASVGTCVFTFTTGAIIDRMGKIIGGELGGHISNFLIEKDKKQPEKEQEFNYILDKDIKKITKYTVGSAVGLICFFSGATYTYGEATEFSRELLNNLEKAHKTKEIITEQKDTALQILAPISHQVENQAIIYKNKPTLVLNNFSLT